MARASNVVEKKKNMYTFGIKIHESRIRKVYRYQIYRTFWPFILYPLKLGKKQENDLFHLYLFKLPLIYRHEIFKVKVTI